MNRTIPRGQYTADRFAAESYIGSHYVTTGPDDGEYSANPADYWNAPDETTIGSIVKREHRYVTATGRSVYAARLVKDYATMGDLRRLARAAESLVR